MKKLLILGSSFTSVEIVQTARRRGWYTIVTDNLPPQDSAAKKAADDYWMISTADIEQLEDKCRAVGIDAIFSGVSEFNLDRVRILCRKLGLPCYAEESAWTFARNKRLFKDKCIEKGIPVAEEYKLPDADDEDSWKQIKFPVVVKPVDGAGNAGLSICNNKQELTEGYKKASAYNNGEVIIERYVTGRESWNFYAIADNVPRHIYSARDFVQPGCPTFLYSFASTVVGDIEDYREQIDSSCTELFKEIGCRDGVAWIQCMRDKDGKYYALEMAHRMSADVCGALLEKVTGFNIVNWMLDTAFGISHTVDMLPQPISRPYPGAVCEYFLFASHAGTISRMEGLDKLDLDLFTVESTERVGKKVEKYRLIAKIVFYARSAEEICSVMAHLNHSVIINDENDRDLVVRYTDYETIRQAHQGSMKELN